MLKPNLSFHDIISVFTVFNLIIMYNFLIDIVDNAVLDYRELYCGKTALDGAVDNIVVPHSTVVNIASLHDYRAPDIRSTDYAIGDIVQMAISINQITVIGNRRIGDKTASHSAVCHRTVSEAAFTNVAAFDIGVCQRAIGDVTAAADTTVEHMAELSIAAIVNVAVIYDLF